jgi:hypothetical protein
MPTITASIDGSAVKAQSRAGIAVTDIQSTEAAPNYRSRKLTDDLRILMRRR